MRRIITYASVIVLGLLLLAYLFLPSKQIIITKDQIDQELARNLPYEIDRLLVSITVQSATIAPEDNNKLTVLAAFDASGFTLEGTGTASVNSSVRYERGKFYLSDLKQDDIQFVLSDNSTDTISDLRSTAENILQRETDEAEESGDAERRGQLVRANMYYETKLQQDAEEALNTFLKSIPIYDLKNAGGGASILALALEDVVISHDQITVTLSFQTFIMRVGSTVLFALFLVWFYFGRFMLRSR